MRLTPEINPLPSARTLVVSSIMHEGHHRVAFRLVQERGESIVQVRVSHGRLAFLHHRNKEPAMKKLILTFILGFAVRQVTPTQAAANQKAYTPETLLILVRAVRSNALDQADADLLVSRRGLAFEFSAD